MNKLETRELIWMCIETENREQLLYFKSLNPRRGHYTSEQKEYAIEKAKSIGIRATSRLLHIPSFYLLVERNLRLVFLFFKINLMYSFFLLLKDFNSLYFPKILLIFYYIY